MTLKTHQTIEETLQKCIPEQFKGDLEIPPPSFLNMKGEFLEYQNNKYLIARFPVETAAFNPMHIVQGGFLAAMVDNTMGPFSFLVAKKPTTTLNLSVNYIRPAKSGSVTIKAILKAKSIRTMYLEAEAFNDRDKILLSANSQVMILGG